MSPDCDAVLEVGRPKGGRAGARRHVPGETAEYRAARDRLLEQEVELRRSIEAVAATRRALPPGGAVAEDYVFDGAGPTAPPTE